MSQISTPGPVLAFPPTLTAFRHWSSFLLYFTHHSFKTQASGEPKSVEDSCRDDRC
eukprot:UN20192